MPDPWQRLEIYLKFDWLAHYIYYIFLVYVSFNFLIYFTPFRNFLTLCSNNLPIYSFMIDDIRIMSQDYRNNYQKKHVYIYTTLPRTVANVLHTFVCLILVTRLLSSRVCHPISTIPPPQNTFIQAQKSEYSVITFFSLNPYFISFA